MPLAFAICDRACPPLSDAHTALRSPQMPPTRCVADWLASWLAANANARGKRVMQGGVMHVHREHDMSRDVEHTHFDCSAAR